MKDLMNPPDVVQKAAASLTEFVAAFMREAKTSVQRGLAADFKDFADELIGLMRVMAEREEAS